MTPVDLVQSYVIYTSITSEVLGQLAGVEVLSKFYTDRIMAYCKETINSGNIWMAQCKTAISALQ